MTRRDSGGLDKKLADVVEALWEEGCPVAGTGGRVKLVSTAVRRWRSFSRRAAPRTPSLEDRGEDLARGLRDHLEPDLALVGPLMEDYRHLARSLARVLMETDE